jgi:hypothetical protein
MMGKKEDRHFDFLKDIVFDLTLDIIAGKKPVCFTSQLFDMLILHLEERKGIDQVDKEISLHLQAKLFWLINKETIQIIETEEFILKITKFSLDLIEKHHEYFQDKDPLVMLASSRMSSSNINQNMTNPNTTNTNNNFLNAAINTMLSSQIAANMKNS